VLVFGASAVFAHVPGKNQKNLYHEIKITRQHLFCCSLKDKPVDKDTMVLILSPNDMMEKGLLLLMHSHVMQSKVNQK
jgi:hypothetical protein